MNPIDAKHRLVAGVLMLLAAVIGKNEVRAAWWSEGLKLAGSLNNLPGLATDVEVDGGRAYVMLEGPVNEEGRPAFQAIGIVNVSNPGRPSLVATWEPAGGVNAFDAENGKLYVVETQFGEVTFSGPQVRSTLNVYNMANPESPRRLGGYTTDGTINRVKVAGNRAYLILDERQFQVIDLGDLARPRVLATVALESEWGHVALEVAPGRAFLGHDGVIEIFDVTNPSEPRLKRTLELPIWYELVVSMRAAGERLYAGTTSQVVIYDLRRETDREKPVTINSLNVGRSEGGGIGKIALSGSRLFVPNHAQGVQAIDTRQGRTGDFMAGYYLTPGSAHAVEARGDLVYVATGERGLMILRAK